MVTTIKVWRAGLVGDKHIKEIWSPNTPLWRHPQLPHLNSIQDPGARTKFKFKKLSQVVQRETMISFAGMIELWNIPGSYAFRYMQLAHALSAQFPQGFPQLIRSGLEQITRRRLGKKLISTIYIHLFSENCIIRYKLRARWMRDVPKLDEENWEEIWGFPFQILVSLRDKLTQFKITHRIYYTTYRLYKMCPLNDCWRCGYTPGDFIHIFWSCPAIAIFWREVIRVITTVTSVALEQDAEICLLVW